VTGPVPKPRWLPLPALRDAQGGKPTQRRRLVAVKHRVVCGTKAVGEQVLAACGWPRNTAGVERRNLRLRQRVAAMRRRGATPCKQQAGVRQPLRRFPG
jgi:hypothetical protein